MGEIHNLPPWSESTLLLLGHGSTTNKQSRVPTENHAETIRKQGIFADVAVGFWKEEPYFSEVLDSISTEAIYVVPNFISEGYYTKEIIPRELGMTGRVSYVQGKCLYYCDPVGAHHSMTKALLRQVEEVLAGAVTAWSKMDLILVGHGTPRNLKSTEMIKKQVQLLDREQKFASCQDAYMEEPPLISNWDQLTQADDVVVVPFFIADGLHSYEDIPEMMGLEEKIDETSFKLPAAIRGKKLWYARSIGNQHEMISVILDLVREFDPQFPFCSSCPKPTNDLSASDPR
ncbi:MAG: CbiX/SirB N-terminal domain-containing protein [Verrucomicrobiota bacterium]